MDHPSARNSPPSLSSGVPVCICVSNSVLSKHARRFERNYSFQCAECVHKALRWHFIFFILRVQCFISFCDTHIEYSAVILPSEPVGSGPERTSGYASGRDHVYNGDEQHRPVIINWPTRVCTLLVLSSQSLPLQSPEQHAEVFGRVTVSMSEERQQSNGDEDIVRDNAPFWPTAKPTPPPSYRRPIYTKGTCSLSTAISLVALAHLFLV